MTGDQREAAIRQLFTQVTGQRFRNLAPGHRGADLVPAFDDADGFDALAGDADALHEDYAFA